MKNNLKIILFLLGVIFVFNSCDEDNSDNINTDDSKSLTVDNLIGTWVLSVAINDGNDDTAKYFELFGEIEFITDVNCKINGFIETWDLDFANKSMEVGAFTFTDINFDGTEFSAKYIDDAGIEDVSITITFIK